MVPMDTVLERVQFLETLKVGDQFWCGHHMDQMVKEKVEVTEINDKLTVNELRYERDYWKEFPELATISLKQYTFKFVASDSKDRVNTTFKKTQRSMDRYVTLKAPYPLSDEQ